MTLELSDIEAKEMVLVLRHFYDASRSFPRVPASVLQIYSSIIAQIQDNFETDINPWSEEPRDKDFWESVS